MIATSERRQGRLLQETRAAADEHTHDSTRPSQEEAFTAFCTLVAYVAGNQTVSTYDQRPGHLPPDARTADAYKRRHRVLRKAGLPGVWVRGKLLCCTPEAWALDLPKAPRKPTLAVFQGPRVDAIDEALGIRTRGAK